MQLWAIAEVYTMPQATRVRPSVSARFCSASAHEWHSMILTIYLLRCFCRHVTSQNHLQLLWVQHGANLEC